jgi:hypothetical protein
MAAAAAAGFGGGGFGGGGAPRGGGGAGAGAAMNVVELGMNNSAVYPFTPAQQTVRKAAAAHHAITDLGIVPIDPRDAAAAAAAASIAARDDFQRAPPGEALLKYITYHKLSQFKIQPLAVPRVDNVANDASLEYFHADFVSKSPDLANIPITREQLVKRLNDIRLPNPELVAMIEAEYAAVAPFFDGAKPVPTAVQENILTAGEREAITGSLEAASFAGAADSYSRKRPFQFVLHNDLQRAVADGKIKHAYTGAETVADTPLYLFLLSPNGHASIMIIYNNILYSIGLGYNEAISERGAVAVAPAMLFSPDFLIRPEEQTRRGIPYKYIIIDVGFLTTGHLNRIISSLEEQKQIKDLIFNKDPTTGAVDADHFKITLNRYYSYVSAAGSDNFINCITFAQKIFKERVYCGAISNPDSCRSNFITNAALSEAVKQAMLAAGADAETAEATRKAYSVTPYPAEELFKLYMEQYQRGEQSINLTKYFELLYTPVATTGGARRRKTRRHRRRHRPKKLDRRTRRR